MNKLLLTFLLLITSMLPVYAQSEKPITQEQAIEIAKQAVLDRGFKPLDWFGGEVRARFDGKKWFIMFVGKPSEIGSIAAGDSVSINVSPEGEASGYSPGM